jgi:hypothetical protein
MSRSGYSDDGDHWAMIRWRGAVTSAFRGRRGQAFLQEMLTALDAMPEKRLVAEELATYSGEVCALGAVGVARGLGMGVVDPEDYEGVAELFRVPRALAQEVMWMNDEGAYRIETPEQRWVRMRAWVASQIKHAEKE